MSQITLDREFVRRISRFTNTLYGQLESGERPSVDLEELQTLDERLNNELNKKL